MILAHREFLFGLLLTAVPVILHLMLRAKPKKLLFPALRLIQNRRRQNVQRMRLRHILLLLLRMAVIALLVFALARPKIPPAAYALTAGEWLKLCLLGGVIAAVYSGVTSVWRRQSLSPHLLSHRRSFLRTGLFVAGLVLFLSLIAWPYQRRIAASMSQPLTSGGENNPVAAVLLFDTSLSMEYRYESRTRLELAQEIATEHVSRLPDMSRVAVGDTSSNDRFHFQADLPGAAAKIKALKAHPASQMLDDRLEAALEFQIEEHERAQSTATGDATESGVETFAREIYVFTDLAASGWRTAESQRLQEQLKRLPSMNIYFIDVGVTTPTNVGLTDLSLSDQTISLGSELTLRARLNATGMTGERNVELHVENNAGKLVKQGQATVKADPALPASLQFSLKGLLGPVRQGELRIVSSDPLAFDDVRYFSVEVRPPPEILVVADLKGDTRYLIEALAPTELVRLGKARYRCHYAVPEKLTGGDLARYAAICLVNVAAPQDAAWNALAAYMKQGGGVAIVLGGRVQQPAYDTPAARSVLPGELRAALPFNPPEFLDLQNLSHPMLKKFADWGVAELTTVEIRRFWRVVPKGSAVIAHYTDSRASPALLERTLGRGRAVLFTTSLDRSWNEIPAVWQFLAFADQMMHYLSHATNTECNYLAGSNVAIPLDAAQPLKSYLLRKPGLQQLRGDVPRDAVLLPLRDIDELGNYRLIDADASKFERGFSVNADPRESNLARLTEDDLQKMLGKDRYSLSRNIEGLRRTVQDSRRGPDVIPWLLTLLMLVFVGEQVIANRFYDDQGAQKT